MVEDRKPLQARDMTLSDLDLVAELHRHCFTSEISIFSALSPDVFQASRLGI
jgi:hypothetical protein